MGIAAYQTVSNEGQIVLCMGSQSVECINLSTTFHECSFIFETFLYY